MKTQKFIHSIILFLFFFGYTYPQAIILDFDNTLVKFNRFNIAKSIGLSDFVLYTIWDFKNPYSLVDEVFHLLDHLPVNLPKHKLPPTTDQRSLPYLFSHWLDGTLQYNQINHEVNNLIKSFSSNNYFENDRHKRLIENSMKCMFNPQILAESIIPIKPALSLVKSCVNKKNSKGEPANELFILSNLASDTLDHFIKTPVGKQVLSNIKPSNIVISGDIGMIKPNEDIFLYFLKKFNLNPKDCIFIDDQISNINTAKKLGIAGILVENNNYKQIRQKLTALEVI